MVDASQSTRNHDVTTRGGTAVSMTETLADDMNSHEERPELWLAGYGLLLAATSVLFLTTWDLYTAANLSVKLIIAAVLVLSIKRWMAPVLLILIQGLLMFFGRWLEDAYGSFSQLFWVCCPIAMLSLMSRYRTLQDHLKLKSTEALSQVSTVLEQYPPAKSSLVINNVRGLLRQLVRESLVIGFCIVMAFVILHLIPVPDRRIYDTIREYRLRPIGFRLLILGLWLFVIWLIAYVFVNELVWRSRSAAQSRMYLRSVMLGWTHRDLRAIVKRRIRVRRQNQRRRQPAEVSDLPAASSLQDNPDELQRML